MCLYEENYLVSVEKRERIMGLLHCCGRLQRSKSYMLAPQSGFLLCELDILDECVDCGHYVVQLTRLDLNHEVSIVRKANTKAREFFQKLETSILFEQKQKFFAGSGGKKFYIGYSEYGVKKRCYSKISTMILGKSSSYEADLNIGIPEKLFISPKRGIAAQKTCSISENI